MEESYSPTYLLTYLSACIQYKVTCPLIPYREKSELSGTVRVGLAVFSYWLESTKKSHVQNNSSYAFTFS